MKNLAKIAVTMVLAGTGLWALGLVMARRFEQGAGFSEADRFRIAAIWGGREFDSTAGALVSGWAVAVFGGIALDLREATLAPGGADLALRATLGGIAVTVPPDWRVEVDERITAGGIDLDITDPDSLPEDAPTLRITATAQSGGIAVSASEEG